MNTIQLKKIAEIAGIPIYQAPDGGRAITFRAGLAVDADGSPRAYHPDGASGLDYLPNAGHPGNWWALATHDGTPHGSPLIQTPGQPAPGYYVSMTALEDARYAYSDPRRYVDSEAVPFIVLPRGLRGGWRLGDVAHVADTAGAGACWAIVADIGPADSIGEGSIALAHALGVAADPRHGGTSAPRFEYTVFPESGNGKPLAASEIEARGKAI